MKLLDQRILVWRDGSVDRIHEVDLLELSPGRAVVNFRYGKRGGPLRDGSKTPMPVPLEQARALFLREIAAKIEKGYVEDTSAVPGGGAERPPPSTASPPAAAPTLRAVPPPPPPSGAGPEGALLRRLAEGERPAAPATPDRPATFLRGSAGIVARQRRRVRKPRPLYRVIERVGELRLEAALPYLFDLLPRADVRLAYVIAGALGRIGGPEASAALVPLLQHADEPLRRRAVEALRLHAPPEARVGLAESRTDRLPEPLRAAVKSHRPERVADEVTALLAEPSLERAMLLGELYLIDSEAVRPALLEAARTLPLRPPFLRVLRHLFKAAEYRRDPALWGTLAWRFETTRAAFRVGKRIGSGRFGERVVNISLNGERKTQVMSRIGAADSALGYSDRTRKYLRIRCWRLLRRLGQDGGPDYVRMAVGALLPWTDADRVEPRVQPGLEAAPPTSGARGRGPMLSVPYPLFHSLVHGNSGRFLRSKRGRMAWLPANAPKTGIPREEAFAELWDRAPAGLLHLLAESRCEAVHVFAVRALQANTPFIDTLDKGVATMLLERPYEGTVALGLKVARLRWPPQGDRDLLLAAAHAAHLPARSQAWQWMSQSPHLLANDSDGIATLLSGPWSDTRAVARQQLDRMVLSPDLARALVVRLVSRLLPLRGPAAADVVAALGGPLEYSFVTVGLSVLRDLMAHPEEAVQALVARVLAARPADQEAALGLLLRSTFPAIRATALSWLDGLGVEALLARPGLLLALAASADPLLRERGLLLARSAVESGGGDNGGAADLALAATALLLEPLPAGAPTGLVSLLEALPDAALADIPEERLHELLRSKRPTAVEAGGLVLGALPADRALDPALYQLVHHEARRVREGLLRALQRRASTLSGALAELTPLTDCRWPESREGLFALLLRLPAEAWTVEHLSTLSDSNRPDVQRFAVQIIQRATPPGQEAPLLRRLAEHPSPRIQSVAVSLLEGVAEGAALIPELEPFFRVLLGQIGRATAARLRLQAWLLRAALEEEAAARVALSVLGPLSATTAIEDRARIIEALAALRRRWPALEGPLRPIPVELRA